MAHHLMSVVKEKLAGVTKHVNNIQRMAEEEKAYPDLMKEICAVHSELESVEQVIVQDLSEHDSNKR